MNNFSKNITIYIAYIILLHAIIPHYHSAYTGIDGKVSNSFCLIEDISIKKEVSTLKQNHCRHQGLHLNHELETGNFHTQKKLIKEYQSSFAPAIVGKFEVLPLLNPNFKDQHLGLKINQFPFQDGFDVNDSLRGPPALI